ncbi:MAG: serine protease [Bdellovibrionales bacterium]
MKFIVTLAVLSLSLTAFAIPEAPFDAFKEGIPKNASLKLLMTKSYDFEGIVKLNNCSGSLVHFEGQPKDSKAIVMTNGHCLGRPFLKPNEVALDKPSNRRMKVAKSDGSFISIRAERLMYGTMTGTDLAYYRLSETYSEIEARGVRSLLVADERPSVGTSIDIVSGYWEVGFRCNVDAFIFELHEAGWIFTDSIRYSNTGCDTYGGTSGSPLIETGSRVVVGINNTGNEDGRKCKMNNPCEVSEEGDISVIKGASYGQQTYQTYACLTDDFKIDLEKVGCDL